MRRFATGTLGRSVDIDCFPLSLGKSFSSSSVVESPDENNFREKAFFSFQRDGVHHCREGMVAGADHTTSTDREEMEREGEGERQMRGRRKARL